MSGSSDPSPSSSAAASPLALLRPHPHAHAHGGHLTPPSPASGGPAPPPPSPASAPRDYRKGNWTLHETLILITAKRLDDDRRAGAVGAAHGHGHAHGSPTTPRSSEQRWKWVENYCWNHGCLRSQNQCNDKWDNLLRDYKKVRDYESRNAAAAPGGGGGARGFAELDIRALLPASPFQHRRPGATCSVCLEEVRGGEMVRSLPGCRHVFHVGCIDPWLHSHATCPLCRPDLSPRRRATMAAVAGLQGGSPSPRLPSL